MSTSRWLRLGFLFFGLLIGASAPAKDIRWSRSYAVSAQSAIAGDRDGAMYVAGKSWDAGQTFMAVTKHDRGGNEVWSKHVLPLDNFSVQDIAVASDGAIVLVGNTGSDALPVSADAVFPLRQGDVSGFVLKWLPEEQEIAWATYLGGLTQSTGPRSFNSINAVEISEEGTIFAVGTTNCTDFPLEGASGVGPLRGISDDVVIALTGDGSSVSWSRYFGGNGVESDFSPNTSLLGEPNPQDLTLDETGALLLVGTTSSIDLPVTDDAFQTRLSGGQDLYVAKLDPGSGSTIWSTYLGGSRREGEPRIAHGEDGFFVAASSESSDFPTTPDAFQTETQAAGDSPSGVVAAFSTLGNLSWSTFYGSIAEACSTELCVAIPLGISYRDHLLAITGRVAGPGLPTTVDAVFQVPQGGSDAFVAMFDDSGSTLEYGTYIGGAAEDYATGGAIGADGELFVIGQASSADFPVDVGMPGPYSGFAMMLATPGSLGALPELSVNGSMGSVTVGVGERISVTTAVDPRDDVGRNADWWLAANSPVGWFSYDGLSEKWVQVGDSASDLFPTFQRPLSLFGPKEVLSTTGLGVGRYVLWFGIDYSINGTVDLLDAVYRRLVVDVQ